MVACDDTGVTLLHPKVPPDFDISTPRQKRAAGVYAEALEKNKPSINAKMWAYRGANVRLNMFEFTVSRHRDGPELFFQDFEGTILGDCWHGFEAIVTASDGAIIQAACSAHARRKFESAMDHPGAIRKYRKKERSDREIRKREQRAKRRAIKNQRKHLKKRNGSSPPCHQTFASANPPTVLRDAYTQIQHPINEPAKSNTHLLGRD